MLRVPTAVLDFCKKHDAAWKTTNNEETGAVDGYKLKVDLQRLFPERLNGSSPLTLGWIFDTQNVITSKIVDMKVPDYDPQDVAEAFLDGHRPRWYHRIPTGKVMETEARIGPNIRCGSCMKSCLSSVRVQIS
jgi:hypothetical protein